MRQSALLSDAIAMSPRNHRRIVIGALIVAGVVSFPCGFILAGRLCVASKTPAWIAQLKDKDPEVRRSAALWLNEMAPKRTPVLEAFIPALEDEDVGVRRQAAFAIAKFSRDAKPAVPRLIEALSDDDPFVRANAADSLGRIGPDARPSIPALIKAQSDDDAYVQRRAGEALATIKRSLPEAAD